MDTRVAVIVLILEDNSSSDKINELLHEYSKYIVARMGVPYKEKTMNIISVVIDAPQEVTGALSGKLGMIKNVTAKTVYSKNK